MNQLSMFSDVTSFPQTYEDLESLLNAYVFEGEKDDDLLMHKDLKKGRSYFIYGRKVLEFIPATQGKPSMKIISPDESFVRYESGSDFLTAIKVLKEFKKKIFRNLVQESFACCNDYKKCSDLGRCLYPDDRFYNGCFYRTNLEAGRNYYSTDSKENNA